MIQSLQLRRVCCLTVLCAVISTSLAESPSGIQSGAPAGNGDDGFRMESGSRLPYSCEGTGGRGCAQLAPRRSLALCHDGDRDGVCDTQDRCPASAPGAAVLGDGCRWTENSANTDAFDTPTAASAVPAIPGPAPTMSATPVREPLFAPGSSEWLDSANLTLDALYLEGEALTPQPLSIDVARQDNASLARQRALLIYRALLRRGTDPRRLVYRVVSDASLQGQWQLVPLPEAAHEAVLAQLRRDQRRGVHGD